MLAPVIYRRLKGGLRFRNIDRHYPSRSDALLALAEAMTQEAAQ